jgi:hypothetical protein
VRGDRNVDLVRLVENRAIERRRQRRQPAVSIVDPDLDELRLDPRVVADGGASLLGLETCTASGS